MAILVSGGAGYIGSHTCIALLNAGYDVVVADNYYNASPVVLDRVKPVSYTHLDVYKRQARGPAGPYRGARRPAEGAG